MSYLSQLKNLKIPKHASTKSFESLKSVVSIKSPIDTFDTGRSSYFYEKTKLLSADDETKIRLWLDHIKAEPDEMSEVVIRCNHSVAAKEYFLKRSEEMPILVHVSRRVSCGECFYYDRINHPHLGHCKKGQIEAIAGLWDTDQRYCEYWISVESNEYKKS